MRIENRAYILYIWTMLVQKFHLLGLKPSRGLLTIIDRKGYPRYVCFKNRTHASECVEFLNGYRRVYDQWPHLDFSAADERFLTPDKSDHALVIHTFSERELDFIAMYSGTAFLVIEEFTLTDDDGMLPTRRARFDGEETEKVVNKHMFITQLEASVKIV